MHADEYEIGYERASRSSTTAAIWISDRPQKIAASDGVAMTREQTRRPKEEATRLRTSHYISDINNDILVWESSCPQTFLDYPKRKPMMRSAAARNLYLRSRAAIQARSGLVVSGSESCRIFSAPPNYQLVFPAGASSGGIRNFADFSMAQLKELRGMSGAPIVDCKKALGETSGNLEEAMDWLRQHGAAKAAKKVSGREADEGLVACTVSDDGKSASLVKVSSETDFAGKSQAFVAFVHHVANATLSSGSAGSLDSEKVMTLQSGSKSVQTALEEAIVAIRENLGVASAIKMTSDDGVLVAYVHGKVSEDSYAGSSAAVVELVGDGVDPKVISDAGKKLAMHIVAAKPTYLKSEDIPSDILDKEREILLGQVRHRGTITDQLIVEISALVLTIVLDYYFSLVTTDRRFEQSTGRPRKDCQWSPSKVLRRSLPDRTRTHVGRGRSKGCKGSQSSWFGSEAFRGSVCLECLLEVRKRDEVSSTAAYRQYV